MKRAYDLAARDFNIAIKLNPKDAEAYNNRCWTLAAIGELQAALSDCEKALEISPGLVDALDSRGLVNLKLGRTSNAIRDYTQVLESNPRSASSLFGRGVAAKRQGGDGVSDLTAAKQLDPGIAKEFASYGISECNPR